MRKVYLLLALLVVALAISSIANASLLPPGSGPLPPDVLTFGGTLLASTSGPFTAIPSPVFSGTYEAAVFADPGNIFCAGCLDFVYEFTNNPTSADIIGRSTTTNFTGFLTDVGFAASSPALSILPFTVDRFTADSIGFTFSAPPVFPGQTSAILEIETNALHFQPGTINFIDGGIATVAGFAPTIPEPSSLLLLGSGLLAAGALLRRKLA